MPDRVGYRSLQGDALSVIIQDRYPRPQDQLKLVWTMTALAALAKARPSATVEDYAKVAAVVENSVDRVFLGRDPALFHDWHDYADLFPVIAKALIDGLEGIPAVGGLASSVAKVVYDTLTGFWDTPIGKQVGGIRDRTTEIVAGVAAMQSLGPAAITAAARLYAEQCVGGPIACAESGTVVLKQRGLEVPVGAGGWRTTSAAAQITANPASFPATVVAAAKVSTTGDVLFSAKQVQQIIAETDKRFEALQLRISSGLDDLKGQLKIVGDNVLQTRNGVACVLGFMLADAQKRAQAEKAAQRAQIENLNLQALGSEVNALAAIVKVLDPHSADVIQRFGTAALSIGNALTAMSNVAKMLGQGVSSEALQIASLGSAIATGNAVAAIMGVVGMFVDNGPSPDQLILEGIDDVKRAVADLQTQVDARFNRVDAALDEIYSQLNRASAAILTDTWKILGGVEAIQEQLVKQGVAINRLQADLSDRDRELFEQGFVEAYDAAMSWSSGHNDPMPKAQFDAFEQRFHAFASSGCAAINETDGTNHSMLPEDVLGVLTGQALHRRIAYVNALARSRGWAAFAADSEVINPFVWQVAANAYYRLCVEHPEFARGIARDRWDQVAVPAIEFEQARERIRTTVKDGGPQLIGEIVEAYLREVEAYGDTVWGPAGALTDMAKALLADVRASLKLPDTAPLVDPWSNAEQSPEGLQAWIPRAIAYVTVAGQSQELRAPAGIARLVPGPVLIREWLTGNTRRDLNAALDASWVVAGGDQDGLNKRGPDKPDKPDVAHYRLTITLTVSDGSVALGRTSISTGVTQTRPWTQPAPTHADAVKRAAGGWESTYRAQFERATGSSLTPQEQPARDQRVKDRSAEAAPLLYGLRADAIRRLADKLDAAGPDSRALPHAGLLATLEAVIVLGFPAAHERDDGLRALLAGAAPALGGAAMIGLMGFGAELRAFATAQPAHVAMHDTVGKVFRMCVADQAELLGRRIREWYGLLLNGHHQEHDRVIRSALAYGEIAWTATHTQEDEIMADLPLVKRGDKGVPVRRVQGLLRAVEAKLTDTQLLIDGEFGAKTAAALNTFQHDAHLPARAQVGDAEWRALLGVEAA